MLTVQISFTNYGDSNRGTRTKDEAISAIIANSVKQTPDSPTYDLRVGTTGSVTDGPFTLFLFDPDTSEIYTATAGSSLEPAEPGAVTLEAVRAHAERALPHYALPRYLEIIDEMPRSAIGKVLRRVVRERITRSQSLSAR